MTSLPILLSIPSESGGEYRLFGEVTNQIITDQSVHSISDEELVKIKRKQLFVRLSKIVETFLEQNNEDSYHLTKYTMI